MIGKLAFCRRQCSYCVTEGVNLKWVKNVTLEIETKMMAKRM